MNLKNEPFWRILFRLMLLLAAGCSPSPSTMDEGEMMNILHLTSSGFFDNGVIPIKYTCDGGDLSPPLHWSDLPEKSVSLVMIADDPDAPGGTWVHWVLFDIPPQLTGLPEGVENSVVVPGIGNQARNDSRKTGYSGPCPPRGKPHRYFFKLYALDTRLGLNPGVSKAEVEKAMQGHILAQGQIMGTYSR